MKTHILIACLLASSLLYAEPVRSFGPARDIPNNPDRYISYGIDFTRTIERGVLSTYPVMRDDGTTIKHYDFIGYSHSELNLDLRVPCNNYLTVTVHGAPQWSDIPGAKVDGYSLGAGLRVYIH